MKDGRLPLFISGHSTSPLGATGFVNAAIEIKEQVMAGEIPEPDYIYVAKGTGDTTAGLILGIKAAKLKSRVVSVSANDKKTFNARKVCRLYDKTALLLHSLDPSFPKLECSDEDLDIRYDFVGRGYACPTEEGLKAMSLMEKNEGIGLDGTYTGKAFACLLDDAGKGYLRDKVVLFWNTYNSRDFSDVLATVDYHSLPRGFHRYFERDGQLSGH